MLNNNGRHAELILNRSGMNGCTVLGVVADNAIVHEHERNRPLMEQDQIQSQETLFSTLGMEADILLAKKIIATVKREPEAAPKRCVMEVTAPARFITCRWYITLIYVAGGSTTAQLFFMYSAGFAL